MVMMDIEEAKKTIRMMVKRYNSEIHDKHSWWNGALNGYLEVTGLSWEFVESIEKEGDI